MIGVPTATDRDSPESLVARAVRGDEAAFARIVRIHRAPMVQVCFVIAGDAGIAAAAVDAAWPVAWRRLRKLRHRDRLRPWLCAIAAGEVNDVSARLARREGAGSTADASTPRGGPDVAGPASDPGLAALLAGLTPDDRALLALKYVAALGPIELERAGVTPSSGARPHLDRLMPRLRDRLGPDEREETGFEARLAQRLRAFSAIPVPAVDVDAVARSARAEMLVARTQVVSVVAAAVIAALFMAAAYVLGGGTRGPPPAPTPSATSAVSAGPADVPWLSVRGPSGSI